MHRLILMRHAEAERAHPGGDRERPLSPRGRDEATRMGRALARRGLRPDLALVSPAARTRQTWDLLQDAFGDVEVRIEPDLYNAPAEMLRALIDEAAEDAGCLLILAHNPGVPVLVGDYLLQAAASPALMERMMGGFPPAGAAVFAIDPQGRRVHEALLTPRDLDALGEGQP